MESERNANLGANDACEKLALEEGGPALNDYTKAWSSAYAFAKHNPELASETSSQALKVISDEQQMSLTKLQQYFNDTTAKGCDK